MANGLRTLACALLVLTAACPANTSSPIYAEISLHLVFQGDGTGVVVVVGENTHTCTSDCNWKERDLGGGGRITFEATADAGSVFKEWTGDCSGTDPHACSVEWGAGSEPTSVDVGASFQFIPTVTATATEFVTVPDAFTVDFDTDGNLFVGNTGASDPSTIFAQVRKVASAADFGPFGDPVADPDVVLVDREGRISTLGANTVLTAGAYDSQYSNNHITEISSDGSVTQPLIEGAPPLLSNPSALAFLSNGDLLVGNYGNNTVSLVRPAGGSLEIVPFYAGDEAASALTSVVVIDDVVYVVTGSKKLTSLTSSGAVIDADLWPSSEDSDPTLAAAGTSGPFDGYLVVAGSDGRVWRMDPQTDAWAHVGGTAFDAPIYGVGVSPVDDELYVIDKNGTIWQVTTP